MKKLLFLFCLVMSTNALASTDYLILAIASNTHKKISCVTPTLLITPPIGFSKDAAPHKNINNHKTDASSLFLEWAYQNHKEKLDRVAGTSYSIYSFDKKSADEVKKYAEATGIYKGKCPNGPKRKNIVLEGFTYDPKQNFSVDKWIKLKSYLDSGDEGY